jgi:hypothetical protein
LRNRDAEPSRGVRGHGRYVLSPRLRVPPGTVGLSTRSSILTFVFSRTKSSEADAPPATATGSRACTATTDRLPMEHGATPEAFKELNRLHRLTT